MKILSITAQKPHSTGSGTYLTELVRSFDAMGHKQAVVCGIYPDDTVEFPEGVACFPVFFTKSGGAASVSDGRSASADSLFAPCKIRAGGSDDQPFSCISFPVTGMSDIMPYESTRYRDMTPAMIDEFEKAFIGAVCRAVSDLDPDLIICHHLFLLTALVRKHFPGRKIYGISHGTDLRQMRNCSDLGRLVQPEIANIDMALALHSEQAAQIKEIFGLDDDHVRVIGSGYNDRLFNTEGRVSYKDTFIEGSGSTSAAPVRLCYAGKISRPKGVPEMLAALERLAADPDIPPFELTMAGGCQDEILKSKLDSLPSYIDYLGQIPQPALAGLLRQTDVFILPSYFEGLPLVLIEAMASGAVPVSTDLPGVKEWIDSNVSGPNVRYVPMPEMKSIDEPTEAGRAKFIDDLSSALSAVICDITAAARGSGSSAAAAGLASLVPDTSSITWSGVAERILSL